ncbi:MAG: DNA-binding response OmpR family regulator [Granulosicoccus sp.]|jgi:DNA-binding response OmpR family regulator
MSDLPVITQHIMVVEDDESLARWIADYLATHNFLVSVATRGDAALEMIRNDMPDAVILDLNLPVMDGLEVCRQARLFFDNPILMLTARDTDNDEVAGLDTGADDYLSKPVKPSILLARLRALLRRSQKSNLESIICIGGLRIDPHSRTVMLFDDVIALSSHEYDVLQLLASNVGKSMSRESLIERIRGIEYDGFDRSVDICISRLRRKLKDDAHVPRRIKTLRGVGYLLTADAW